jgi:tRNA(Ile)-lysidine synthase
MTIARWLAGGLRPVWVVAVSGGSDSVGMVRALHELAPTFSLQLSVAHLDHGVRGEGARRDAEFVAELAACLNLPFDLGEWQPVRSAHFEADARRARYAWLVEIARSRGASAVAVAHTRDDQAETVLHRILRGTGPRGLAGIPARRPLGDGRILVRPLLQVSRQEVHDYLQALDQPYRDDPTNVDLSRTRARIRHDLLPRLRADYNPKVAEALVRLGDLSRESHRALVARLKTHVRSSVIETNADAVVMLLGPLRKLPLTLRAEVIRLAWRRAGWPESAMTATRWLRLAASAGAERGRYSLGAGFDVWLSADVLRISQARGESGTRPAPVSVAVPGSVRWDRRQLVLTLDPSRPAHELVDFDQVAPFKTSGPHEHPVLWVRTPVPRDVFDPLGMDGKSMPLNDFLRGRKVPPELRGQIPLLCDRTGIIWVVGHRIADRVRRTAATERTLGLSWLPVQDDGDKADR